jgi:hypothetical protein
VGGFGARDRPLDGAEGVFLERPRAERTIETADPLRERVAFPPETIADLAPEVGNHPRNIERRFTRRSLRVVLFAFRARRRRRSGRGIITPRARGASSASLGTLVARRVGGGFVGQN